MKRDHSGPDARCYALYIFTLILLELLHLSPAMAESAILSVIPGTVTIEANSSTTIVAISDEGEAVSSFQVLTPPGVQCKIISAPDTQSPKQSLSWILQLKTDPAFTTEGIVVFQLLRNGQTPAVAQVKIIPKAAPTVAESVQAELLFDGEILLDGRDGTALLQITNLTDYDLTVSPPRPLTPPEIQLTTNIMSPTTLAAHSTLISQISVGVAPSKTLISGKHKIGLVVPLARVSRDLPWKGEVSVSTEISAGVPGMTDLQNVLQIPSLLLLPGLLVVISFFAIRNFGKPMDSGSKMFTRFSFVWSPWLWISAITLSGFIAFIYPEVTSWLGPVRRDILYGYSVKDLVIVWIGSITVGIGSALLINLEEYAFAKIRENRQSVYRKQPLKFLKKLERTSETGQLAYVDINGHRLYRLNPNEFGEEVWAAPAIHYEPKDPSVFFDTREIARKIKQENLSDLRKHLEGLSKSGKITLQWDNFEQIQGPTRVPIRMFSNLDLQCKGCIVAQ